VATRFGHWAAFLSANTVPSDPITPCCPPLHYELERGTTAGSGAERGAACGVFQGRCAVLQCDGTRDAVEKNPVEPLGLWRGHAWRGSDAVVQGLYSEHGAIVQQSNLKASRDKRADEDRENMLRQIVKAVFPDAEDGADAIELSRPVVVTQSNTKISPRPPAPPALIYLNIVVYVHYKACIALFIYLFNLFLLLC